MTAGYTAPASLDPQETAVEPEAGPLSSHGIILAEIERGGFYHSGWHASRIRVAKAMIAAGVTNRRLWRFASCGQQPHCYVHTDDARRVKIVTNYCRDRFCQRCQAARAQRIKASITDQMAGRVCRFITLTLRSTTDPLQVQITRLLKAFKRLRGTRLWTSTQRGGVASLEITLNSDTLLWHPHLHVIAEGSFIPHSDLRKAWLKITGDSHIVDVKLIRSTDEVVDYVAHYATLLTDAPTNRSRPHLAQAISSLAGRRTVLTFGTWITVKLVRPRAPSEWRLLCSLEQLEFTPPRSLSILAAQAILLAWQAREPGACLLELTLPARLLHPDDGPDGDGSDSPYKIGTQ